MEVSNDAVVADILIAHCDGGSLSPYDGFCRGCFLSIMGGNIPEVSLEYYI